MKNKDKLKSSVSVVTIGHANNRKSTLTAAITKYFGQFEDGDLAGAPSMASEDKPNDQ